MLEVLSRRLSRALLIALCILSACARRQPLTAATAAAIIGSREFSHEPVYAEVPQHVWWDSHSPQDAYDVKTLITLRRLEQAGLVKISESRNAAEVSYLATLTAKGFTILGTVPSLRGPCFRAQICEKRYDGLRDFQRHPNDPTIAHAELIWHYARPTPLYPIFETKIDKPLDTPFASFVSFYYRDYQWRFEITVPKTAPP